MIVHKACPCVVAANRILAFEHPLAGFQIPKGSVEPGEPVERAVLRELAEESGIETGRIIAKIAGLDWLIEAGTATFEEDQLQRWHLYLVDPGAELPSRWSHRAVGSRAEDGLVFRYFWQSLEAVPEGFHPVYRRVITLVANFQKYGHSTSSERKNTMDIPLADKIEQFVDDAVCMDKEKGELLLALRKIIQKACPAAREDIRYGGLVINTPAGLICGLFIRQQHISLEFGSGNRFADPDGHLEGSGQHRRHLKIRAAQDISDKRVEFFVNQAFAY